ncbi:TetR/AcrR family transcriptional regulator [Peribacillus frigoritolerans]|uniref:TetR/AcrR family transcriptional regulator n=1 Tax=Peribacillus frigoritolerans TaxID=450367 RepID=UPI002B2537EB|nr:TetR/AcrR family transcriptional regulator [Peribacillus frigoritolerans]MEB2493246.1 TetR/AcrR family transcriptional regulator [Peribacillus frigoritolerans]
MTYNQIKNVALNHFTDNGYEGTSMAQIAEDVGIKKPSLYSHFKGKDELFLQVCSDVFDDELKFAINYIDSNKTRPIEEFLFNFLIQFKERYERNRTTKFWLRISFFPPTHLYEQVIKYVYEYLDEVEEHLLLVIERAMIKGEINSTNGAKRVTAAFLGVLDGIFVEMLYGGSERLMKRLDASWYFYWRGLTKE